MVRVLANGGALASDWPPTRLGQYTRMIVSLRDDAPRAHPTEFLKSKINTRKFCFVNARISDLHIQRQIFATLRHKSTTCERGIKFKFRRAFHSMPLRIAAVHDLFPYWFFSSWPTQLTVWRFSIGRGISARGNACSRSCRKADGLHNANICIHS